MKKSALKLMTTVIALMMLSPAFAQHKAPKWLEDAVFYQIYPSAFMDSDGNGIGDLPGITSKLDYIKDLGVNSVWINACCVSGWKDGGYDVIDYYQIDPRFGTNTDLVTLVNEAHKRGIRICMDLVAGHSSDQSEWFLQSKSGKDMRYSDYYIWTDEISEQEKQLIIQRHQEVNPAASFTGRFVEANAPRAKYFEKNYYESQPALNYGYANPDPNHPWEQPVDAPGPRALRQEMKNIIAFWFDKGVDGFRVDMAQSLVKNDTDGKATAALWHEMRSWVDTNYPDHILLAEWSAPMTSIPAGFDIDFFLPWRDKNGYKELILPEPYGVHKKDYFHPDGNGSIKEFVPYYTKCLQELGDKGYVALQTSNHDFHRPNYGDRNTIEQLKVSTMFFLTLHSMPFIYYGDEIGMKYNVNAPEKEGSREDRPGFFNERSGERTPMQWTNGKNAGFSTCEPENLFLPIDTDNGKLTVETQEQDPNSLLNYVKQLLKLRKDHKAMGNTGDWVYVGDINQPYPMVYKRTDGKETFMVVLNPSAKKVKAIIPSQGGKQATYIMGSGKNSYKPGKTTDRIEMNGISCGIYKIE